MQIESVQYAMFKFKVNDLITTVIKTVTKTVTKHEHGLCNRSEHINAMSKY